MKVPTSSLVVEKRGPGCVVGGLTRVLEVETKWVSGRALVGLTITTSHLV